MKYGVIVCRETKNIGDDIQSYAAARLLPRVDYYIEREHMDVFRPMEDECVATIMNGWFMDHKLGWPVSPCINPLYVSMHFLEKDWLMVEDTFLKGVGGEDLVSHGPVGARDTSTLQMLERNGIPAYFSGCLTLTLPQMPKHDVEEPYVCLTDVSNETIQYVKALYPDVAFRVIEQVASDGPYKVDQNAPWPERFRRVEELLEVYQNAAAVITTRLHCAMPCLALGVPVLFLRDDSLTEGSRLDGLFELANSAKTSDFLQGNVLFDLNSPPANPTGYQEFRRKLIETVNHFLAENRENTEELKERFLQYDKDWERRALWKNEILLTLKSKHDDSWNEYHEYLEKLSEGKKWLEEQWKGAVSENTRLKQQCEKLSGEKEQLEQWCKEQAEGKDWLEGQWKNLTEENKRLKQQCRELTEGKEWLEGQWRNLLRENRELSNQRDALAVENEKYRKMSGWDHLRVALKNGRR